MMTEGKPVEKTVTEMEIERSSDLCESRLENLYRSRTIAISQDFGFFEYHPFIDERRTNQDMADFQSLKNDLMRLVKNRKEDGIFGILQEMGGMLSAFSINLQICSTCDWACLKVQEYRHGTIITERFKENELELIKNWKENQGKRLVEEGYQLITDSVLPCMVCEEYARFRLKDDRTRGDPSLDFRRSIMDSAQIFRENPFSDDAARTRNSLRLMEINYWGLRHVDAIWNDHKPNPATFSLEDLLKSSRSADDAGVCLYDYKRSVCQLQRENIMMGETKIDIREYESFVAARDMRKERNPMSFDMSRSGYQPTLSFREQRFKHEVEMMEEAWKAQSLCLEPDSVTCWHDTTKEFLCDPTEGKWMKAFGMMEMYIRAGMGEHDSLGRKQFYVPGHENRYRMLACPNCYSCVYNQPDRENETYFEAGIDAQVAIKNWVDDYDTGFFPHLIGPSLGVVMKHCLLCYTKLCNRPSCQKDCHCSQRAPERAKMVEGERYRSVHHESATKQVAANFWYSPYEASMNDRANQGFPSMESLSMMLHDIEAYEEFNTRFAVWNAIRKILPVNGRKKSVVEISTKVMHLVERQEGNGEEWLEKIMDWKEKKLEVTPYLLFSELLPLFRQKDERRWMRHWHATEGSQAKFISLTKKNDIFGYDNCRVAPERLDREWQVTSDVFKHELKVANDLRSEKDVKNLFVGRLAKKGQQGFEELFNNCEKERIIARRIWITERESPYFLSFMKAEETYNV